MTYKDLGYNKLLQKGTYVPSTQSEDVSSQYIPQITGSSIVGGISSSPDGKMIIDWANGRIIISDGAYNRVLIGDDGL